ncbi:MAG: hypothetical protein HUU06_11730 [Planctomycetaceae bacterium]|nr:hypothetical protein [Planctomycetota bacterium]NUN53441.1 hypothetical protein [Planctomycetaceae bacterium]
MAEVGEDGVLQEVEDVAALEPEALRDREHALDVAASAAARTAEAALPP